MMAQQKIKSIADSAFKEYGRVIEGYDCHEIIEKMKTLEIPADVTYVASEPILEQLAITKQIKDHIYGQMPVQAGYCNGHNQSLNAIEYHRDSEINIAATDLILMLGKQQDINSDYTYDTSKIELFLIPAKTIIEVYATTLHYAPCQVNEEGFGCVVILPKGTNQDLAPMGAKTMEDQLLFARNKWLIGHPEGNLPNHAFIGLIGENISI